MDGEQVYKEQKLEGNTVQISDLVSLLTHDDCVKVAGIDIDGVLRGKLISKEKFLSIAQDGFGFASVLFAWDLQDQM